MSAGASLIVPPLVLLLGLPMTVAVGTSLLIIVVNSAAGFAAHARDTPLDYRLAAVFTLAAVAGSVLAAPLATRVAAHRLRRWFAYLVLAIAAFVVIQALLDHAGGDEPRDREPTVVHTGHNRRTTREVRIMLGGGMGAGFGVDGAGSGC